MSRYRKVSPSIWNDDKFRLLSNDGQLIFLFLLTHPHQTSLGAMRASTQGLAAEKRWPFQRFTRAFKEIETQRMVRYDCEASLIWLPNFLKHNGPENPNVIKSWAHSLELLPDCPLKCELINHVRTFVEGLPEGFQEGLPESFRKGMPIQEPENQHEQEPENQHEQEYNNDKTVKRRSTYFPSDFLITDDLRIWATENNLPSPDREFQLFKDYHLSKDQG